MTVPTVLGRRLAGPTILVLVAVAGCYGLSAHRSDEPFIFGYSLFYLLCLFLGAGTLVFTGLLFRRFRSSAWLVIGAIVIPLSVFAALVEAGAQVYAVRHPSYEVLYLQPDRQTGWKLVPNLHFTWAGPHWAAFEFSVPIVLNSAGFRDVERTVERPPGVVRVALLGDSFVEALQVPFDRTAGHLLELSLNSTEGERAVPHPKYEVLNFGVSAYGLGQYLLNWETYVRAYKPDWVFAYVAGFHFTRTVSKGGMITQGSLDLRTRPTFKLESNQLVLEPAEDFEQFVAAQQEILRDQLGGERMRKRRPGFFLRIVLDETNSLVTSWQRRLLNGGNPASGLSDETIAVNVRILEELGASVSRAGGRLIIADATRYGGDSASSRGLSNTLQSLCAKSGFGYVSVSDELLRKKAEGIPTARAYDGHFNEAGNEAFAAAMYRWMASARNMLRPEAASSR